MEAEHLYHWLGRFFKESPKITWEKNEIQDALKEQYIELLNSDFTVEPPIPRSSARTPPAHQEPAPKTDTPHARSRTAKRQSGFAGPACRPLGEDEFGMSELA